MRSRVRSWPAWAETKPCSVRLLKSTSRAWAIGSVASSLAISSRTVLISARRRASSASSLARRQDRLAVISAHSACSCAAVDAASAGVVGDSHAAAFAAGTGDVPRRSASISAVVRRASERAACNCSRMLAVSAAALVASSSTLTWPALTESPSFTKTCLTTLVSSGCRVLLRSLTTIRPNATAMMSS
jgi:hypothetical protein